MTMITLLSNSYSTKILGQQTELLLFSHVLEI